MPQAEHTLEMLSQAADLEVTLTGSALEAAVLESDEIKQYSPPYNVALQKGQRKLACSATRDLHAVALMNPIKSIVLGPLPAGKHQQMPQWLPLVSGITGLSKHSP